MGFSVLRVGCQARTHPGSLGSISSTYCKRRIKNNSKEVDLGLASDQGLTWGLKQSFTTEANVTGLASLIRPDKGLDGGWGERLGMHATACCDKATYSWTSSLTSLAVQRDHISLRVRSENQT